VQDVGDAGRAGDEVLRPGLHHDCRLDEERDAEEDDDEGERAAALRPAVSAASGIG
jgi:hypothetical protein